MKLPIISLVLVLMVAGCGDKKTRKVTFQSEGAKLVGNLYYPKNFESGKEYPGIVVAGSWTTVKEQMAGFYAKKLAEKGYITLAFDFRNFGESEGMPRFYESPAMKIADIGNAVKYMISLDEVADEQVGAFGVCAGAGYVLSAAADNDRIKAVVTVASWLHDSEAVKLFYGGTKGVQEKISAARDAKKKYADTGDVVYIPAISTTDESAAMYGPYDYYLNEKRGAIPQWSADKFAVMSWEDWLTFDPMPTAARLTAPTLMIHSDGAVLPDYTKRYYQNIKTNEKKLHWISSGKKPPMEQFAFYDEDAKVSLSVTMADDWYDKHLK